MKNDSNFNTGSCNTQIHILTSLRAASLMYSFKLNVGCIML